MGLREDADSLRTQAKSKQNEAVNIIQEVRTHIERGDSGRAQAAGTRATQLTDEVNALLAQAEEKESQAQALEREINNQQQELETKQREQNNLQGEIDRLQQDIGMKRTNLSGSISFF